MNQMARIRRPCLLPHYRFHSYYKSTVEETALTHKDEGRTDCLAGKESKGVWSSLEKTASCSMGKKECEATLKGMGHLQSDHEEADTRIILHAL